MSLRTPGGTHQSQIQTTLKRTRGPSIRPTMRLSLLLLFFIAPLVTIEVTGNPVQAEPASATCTMPINYPRDGAQTACEG